MKPKVKKKKDTKSDMPCYHVNLEETRRVTEMIMVKKKNTFNS